MHGPVVDESQGREDTIRELRQKLRFTRREEGYEDNLGMFTSVRQFVAFSIRPWARAM